MSVIRNSSNRSQARKAWSSPYSRLTSPVTSLVGWAFDYISGRTPKPPASFQSDTPNASNTPSEQLESTNQRALQPERTVIQQQEINRSVRPQDSPPNTLSADSAGSGDVQQANQFSFQYADVKSASSSSNPPRSQPTTPRKKLSKNPNGTYRWEGAGSAKQHRASNRYNSPAFLVSHKPQHLLMRDTTNTGETPVPDGKRRRVEQDALTSPVKKASSVPFPHTSSPTTPRTNGANGVSRSTTLPSTSRLRTPAKPSVPAIPSPLRQAWSEGSSTSSREESRASPPQPAKQTQTASFMAELIKETTPPKKPDLSNPYQTASPVGKVGPPKRNTRRPRATGKPVAPAKDQTTEEKAAASDKEKVKEYSPQAIIEATVPKGSKRSRPPSHLERRSPSEDVSQAPFAQREPPVVAESPKTTYVVEEPEEDEEESRRATKKAKPSISGHGLSSSVKVMNSTSVSDADIVVEEVDMDMSSAEAEKAKAREPLKLTTQVNGSVSPSPLSATSPGSRSSFNGPKPSSIPKEPSKLRFSFQAETPAASPLPPSAPASDVTPTPSSLPAPTLPKTDFKFTPPSSGFNFTFKSDSADTDKPEKATKWDAEAFKEKVRAMPTSSLPVFAFGVEGTSVLPSTPEHLKLQNDVKTLPKSSLPTFDFGSSKAMSFSFTYDPSMPKAPGSYSGSYKPSPPKVNKPTVVRPISSPSPTPSGPSPAPVQAFDFAAAGMKAPVIAKDSKTCSSCGLSSPATALKCSVCDEPFPGSTSAATPPPVSTPTPPAPPAGGFNWAAAGMKPPSAAKGTWKCSDCGLDSPEAKIECTVCGAPKP